MRKVLVGCVGAALIAAASLAPTLPALADSSLNTSSQDATLSASEVNESEGSREDKTIRRPASHHKTRAVSNMAMPKYRYVSKAEYKQAVAVQAEKLRAYKRFQAAQSTYYQCAADPFMSACPRPANVAAPGQLNVRPAQAAKKGVPAPPPRPAVSPEEAAYVAFARLRLTPPKPMIGPPPQINEWKMAAVGYPMWLWAEGNLDPAAVSDTVYDLTVSLDAHLVKTTFDLGDGHRLTCTDLSRAWVRGITPGRASPTCGYTYTKPSLPRGSYTITAYSEWAVDWAVNGVGGTIPLYQQASTKLPVGELQVLVR